MRKLALLIVFLLLFAPIPGVGEEELVTLKVNVVPEDAQVYILGKAREFETDHPRPLGRANESLVLKKKLLEGGNLVLTLKAEGYEDYTGTFEVSNQLRNSIELRIPAKGESISLVPISQTRLYISLTIIGLLGVGGLAFAVVSRQKRGVKEVLDLQSWLEQSKVPSADDNSLVGKKMGDYWLLEEVGQGGMATVYRGEKFGAEEQTKYAIKVIHSHLAGGEDFSQRFQREALIGSKLIHPNIVTVYEASEQDGQLYMSLEFVEGDSLEKRFADSKDVLQTASQLFPQLYGAVHFAHEHGVVHRDLKPENVLVSEEGRVKLSDFGLARSHDLSKYTKTGTVLGTPSYMAPEQITGQEPVPATDQYALGVLSFELLTGELPFKSEEMMALLTFHLMEPPPDASERSNIVPKSVAEVLQKMMAKTPEERFSSVKEALSSLQEALESSSNQ